MQKRSEPTAHGPEDWGRFNPVHLPLPKVSWGMRKPGSPLIPEGRGVEGPCHQDTATGSQESPHRALEGSMSPGVTLKVVIPSRIWKA